MKVMNLYLKRTDNQKNPPLRIEAADSFFQRFLGLMGHKPLPAGNGLLLAPCSSIHMCFMWFAIDAIYIDQDYRVLKVVKGLRPWIGISICWKAWAVIEVRAGEAEKNLVVSPSGLKAARYLEERFGVPYDIDHPLAAGLTEAVPVSMLSGERILILHQQVLQTKQNLIKI